MTATDKFMLQGKVALVTGGAGILGRGFVKGLAEAGAQVAIVDMQADAVDALHFSPAAYAALNDLLRSELE